MHSRMILLGREISHLLRYGFSDGAASRACTLYELVVKSWVICNDASPGGWDLAERYYISSRYEEHGRKWLTADLPEKEARIRDGALARWGVNFFNGENNWAAPATGNPEKKRVTFKDLEDSVEIDSIKQAYREFNHAVHAGSSGTLSSFQSNQVEIYNMRGRLNPELTGYIGYIASVLLDAGVLGVLRSLTSSLEQWDYNYSGAEFCRLIEATIEAFVESSPEATG
ncbi:MAG: DUF5677 domain-containing protein [Gaiellales bacterium]